MSTHPSEIELQALLERAMGGEGAPALEAHVDGCEACARTLQSMARAEIAVRALFAERRCGTAVRWEPDLVDDAPAPNAAPRQRPPVGLFAAVAGVVFLLITALPTPSHGAHAAAAEEPCGGLIADAGSPVAAAAVYDEHGTP